MYKVVSVVKRNWSYLAGAIAGGIGGYFYWFYIGCSSGTCPITSSLSMSVIWGGLLGSMIFNSIFGSKNK